MVLGVNATQGKLTRISNVPRKHERVIAQHTIHQAVSDHPDCALPVSFLCTHDGHTHDRPKLRATSLPALQIYLHRVISDGPMPISGAPH